MDDLPSIAAPKKKGKVFSMSVFYLMIYVLEMIFNLYTFADLGMKFTIFFFSVGKGRGYKAKTSK